MNSRISIIIPTYKRPQVLLEAVTSCLGQSYPAYEIIIGDDSPDYDTENALSSINNKSNILIKYIHNIPSLGQARNVDKLISQASGDKLMLLHDDDLLVAGALEKLIYCFNKDKAVKIAYGKQYLISDCGEILYKESEKFNKDFYRTSEYSGSKLTSLEAGLVQQFPNDAFLIDTQLAKTIGYRNVGDGCDYDFGLRVGKSNQKICFVDEYTAKYRISEVSISASSKLNDAGLTAYLMAIDTAVPSSSERIKDKWLKSRAGVALGDAIAYKRTNIAIKIYFSKYYMKNIFSLGGVKKTILMSYLIMYNLLNNLFRVKSY